MTKKNVLRISSAYIIYFSLLLVEGWLCNSKWCQTRDDDFFGLAIFVFSPLAFVFLFSLITYKMREEVFRAWVRFSYVWVPLSMLFVLITPDGQGGSFGIPSLIDKQVVAFLTSLIFVIISLIIIVVKSLKLRKK